MATRSIVYELSVQGVEQAKADLASFHKTLREGGTVDWSQYNRTRSDAIRMSRAYTGQQRIEHQMWLAMHPRIREVSDAMGTFSRMTGMAMSAMNTINLATVLFNQNQAQHLALTQKVSQAERELGIALKNGGSQEEIANLSEQLSLAKVQLKEFDDQASQQKMQGYLSFAASIGHLASGFTHLITRSPELVNMLRKISGAFSGGGAGGSSGPIIPPSSGSGGETIARGTGISGTRTVTQPGSPPGSAPITTVAPSTGAGCLEICKNSQAGIGQAAGAGAAQAVGNKLMEGLRSALPYVLPIGFSVGVLTLLDKIKNNTAMAQPVPEIKGTGIYPNAIPTGTGAQEPAKPEFAWPELPKWTWPDIGFKWPALPEWKWSALPTWAWPALPPFMWPAYPLFKWPEMPKTPAEQRNTVTEKIQEIGQRNIPEADVNTMLRDIERQGGLNKEGPELDALVSKVLAKYSEPYGSATMEMAQRINPNAQPVIRKQDETLAQQLIGSGGLPTITMERGNELTNPFATKPMSSEIYQPGGKRSGEATKDETIMESLLATSIGLITGGIGETITPALGPVLNTIVTQIAKIPLIGSAIAGAATSTSVINNTPKAIQGLAGEVQGPLIQRTSGVEGIVAPSLASKIPIGVIPPEYSAIPAGSTVSNLGRVAMTEAAPAMEAQAPNLIQTIVNVLGQVKDRIVNVFTKPLLQPAAAEVQVQNKVEPAQIKTTAGSVANLSQIWQNSRLFGPSTTSNSITRNNSITSTVVKDTPAQVKAADGIESLRQQWFNSSILRDSTIKISSTDTTKISQSQDSAATRITQTITNGNENTFIGLARMAETGNKGDLAIVAALGVIDGSLRNIISAIRSMGSGSKSERSSSPSGLSAGSTVTTGNTPGASRYSGQSFKFGSINVKVAAQGMHETVSRPTLILAGEAGKEHINITPLERMAIGGTISEPVKGIGQRTGKRYLIGEDGEEAVVPLTKSTSTIKSSVINNVMNIANKIGGRSIYTKKDGKDDESVGPIVAMATGGIIKEPVDGIGRRTGTRYLMGESGNEVVVPVGNVRSMRSDVKNYVSNIASSITAGSNVNDNNSIVNNKSQNLGSSIISLAKSTMTGGGKNYNTVTGPNVSNTAQSIGGNKINTVTAKTYSQSIASHVSNYISSLVNNSDDNNSDDSTKTNTNTVTNDGRKSVTNFGSSIKSLVQSIAGGSTNNKTSNVSQIKKQFTSLVSNIAGAVNNDNDTENNKNDNDNTNQISFSNVAKIIRNNNSKTIWNNTNQKSTSIENIQNSSASSTTANRTATNITNSARNYAAAFTSSIRKIGGNISNLAQNKTIAQRATNIVNNSVDSAGDQNKSNSITSITNRPMTKALASPAFRQALQSGNVKFAAQGMNERVNKPTIIVVGENGEEHVSITPSANMAKPSAPIMPTMSVSAGKGSGGGANLTVNNYITVQGNVWTTEQLYSELDRRLERDFRQRGGFGQ